MKSNPLPIEVTISPLEAKDIAAVEAIERAAYRSTPPQKSYAKELANPLAHYLVLRIETDPSEPPEPVGIAGYWLIAAEIHIMTIAIDPAWQKRGLAQRLLAALLRAGRAQGAKAATLEVRPSNRAALVLYHNCGFREVGRRVGYYADTGEDALILTTSQKWINNF